MKRTLKAEEARLWALVASTVRPAPGRTHASSPTSARASREEDALDMEAAMERAAANPPKAKAHRRVPPPSGAPAGSARPDGERVPSAKAALPSRPRPQAEAMRAQPSASEPKPIEPLRRRRIVRERDAIGARLDLHGLDQDRARGALHAFLARAHAQGHRAVLVITGKGALGDGILRRRAPEWLTEPAVRPLIAGVSQADRRHGGAGALYIALKRRGA